MKKEGIQITLCLIKIAQKDNQITGFTFRTQIRGNLTSLELALIMENGRTEVYETDRD